MSDTTRPTYFATKYDSAAAEVIALLSDELSGFGQRDTSTGDVESPTGYFALVVLDDATQLDFADLTSYPADDQAGEVAREYGVTAADVMGAHIVTTNSQGFVYVETFASAVEARAEFDSRAEAYGAWVGDDD